MGEFTNLPPDLIACHLCPELDTRSYFRFVVALFPAKAFVRKIVKKTINRWEELRQDLYSHMCWDAAIVCCPNMPRRFGGHRRRSHYQRCHVFSNAFKSYFQALEERIYNLDWSWKGITWESIFSKHIIN